jgi:hypothetical protein
VDIITEYLQETERLEFQVELLLLTFLWSQVAALVAMIIILVAVVLADFAHLLLNL